MRPFDGRHVLLGITGGIASYKSAWLARLLTQAGAAVDVVMTRSASEFIGAVTFEALTGRAVHTELVAAGHALDHIQLAREADVIVVAPATADFLARAATGQAGDLLTACLLAAGDARDGRPTVLLVPAMNDRMWLHPQTIANVAHLRSLGYAVLDPDTGELASREEGSGPGRMPEPATIVAQIGRLLESQALAGKRVVVTAGPTREPIDPVRFISNHSSGRMGVEIAAAAWRRGAEVTLVAGPLSVPVPPGLATTMVNTADEMLAAVRDALATADVLVMAAAPADFRATDVASQKIKKSSAPSSIALSPAPDILRETRDVRRKGAVIVGFALETSDVNANGRKKLEQKEMDFVVVNDATEAGAGFGVTTNRVTIIDRNGREERLPLLGKDQVADAILDRVEHVLSGR